ncbi:MAG: MFS transporter [Candidatus Dojkabacteria bacterium]|nr:MAG: MFS transporter [Candidatus Dojkabacteria bacterium]
MPKRIATLQFNKIILYLTYSDIVILSAWGLINPFIQLYMAEEINGGTIAAAGFATTIFLVFKSVFQMPVAKRLDANGGEYDDYKYLVGGSLLVAWTAFLFAFATEVWHVYVIQALSGFALALTFPSFNAIFTRHLGKNQEAMGWGFYDTIVGLGTALTAALGGLMIQYFNYRAIFMLVAIASVLGTLYIVAIKDSLYDFEVKKGFKGQANSLKGDKA